MTEKNTHLEGQLQNALNLCYQVPGQTYPSELTWLYYAIGLRSNFHVEIGSWCGRSLIPVAAGMQINGGGIIYSIDSGERTPDLKPFGDWFAAVYEATLTECRRMFPDVDIQHLNGDSLEMSRGVPNDIASLFIDAGHHYEDVHKDIQTWQPKMARNGIISGHDYWANDAGVMDAVHELVHDFELVPKTRIWYAESTTPLA